MRLSGAGASRFLGLAKYSMTKRSRPNEPTRIGSSNANTAANGNYSVTLDFSEGARASVRIARREDRHSWDAKSYIRPNTPLDPDQA